MNLTRPDHLNTLIAAAWDLRATIEAQLRALTSLQRCIEDYQGTSDVDALAEIDKHLATIAGWTESVRDTAVVGREQVAALQTAR